MQKSPTDEHSTLTPIVVVGILLVYFLCVLLITGTSLFR